MRKLQSGTSGRDLASHVRQYHHGINVLWLGLEMVGNTDFFFLLPLPAASMWTEPTRPALGSAGSGSLAEDAPRDLSHSELLSTFLGAHIVLILVDL